MGPKIRTWHAMEGLVFDGNESDILLAGSARNRGLMQLTPCVPFNKTWRIEPSSHLVSNTSATQITHFQPHEALTTRLEHGFGVKIVHTAGVNWEQIETVGAELDELKVRYSSSDSYFFPGFCCVVSPKKARHTKKKINNERECRSRVTQCPLDWLSR